MKNYLTTLRSAGQQSQDTVLPPAGDSVNNNTTSAASAPKGDALILKVQN